MISPKNLCTRYAAFTPAQQVARNMLLVARTQLVAQLVALV